MNPADTWAYHGHDDCADFFGQCLKAAKVDVPADARVLEIGCAEFDWLTPARTSWPEMSLVGVDWRVKDKNESNTPSFSRLHGDARNPDLFTPETFDWIVSISAIEHVGLGHYKNGKDSDPVDSDGDTAAITNAFRWLKPGGWLLFDVPYHPQEYRVCGTEYRLYNDDAIWNRLWVKPLCEAKAKAKWHGTWYAEAGKAKALVEKPSQPCHPFHYVGLAWQKVG